MSKTFHRLQVERAWDTTPRARVAEFRVPEDLEREFAYRAGQYVMVRIDVDGVEQDHAFSLCSSPEAGQPLTIAVKRTDSSLVAAHIQSLLLPGKWLMVRPPSGTFVFDLSPNRQRTFVLFAAGSGITPLLSIATSVLHTEPQSSVHLVYANVSATDTMFVDELRQLKKQFAERLQVSFALEDVTQAHLDDIGSVQVGRFGATDIVEAADQAQRAALPTEFAICGPSGFIELVTTSLGVFGVPSEHIHVESFSSSPRQTTTP
jgi:ring-1,2-phenylacetyl-CoA epoxidase subunit PaaE